MGRSVSKVNYGTVAVADSASLIKAGVTTRRSITIQNNHATQTLHIGNTSAVTTSTGLKIAAGASFTIEDYNGPIYGIASGADTTTNYFETYGA